MTTTNDIGTTVDPLSAAVTRAAVDPAFAATLKSAGKAGAILGAVTNLGSASTFFRVLADDIAKPAQVVLGARSRDDGKDGSADLPTAEAAPLLLLELCGLVNHAIASAQTTARLAAIQRMKAAEIQKAAKNARKAVIEKMRRYLAVYSLSVDFSAGTCKATDAPETLGDGEKASARILSAFNLDVRGAIAGLTQLPAQQWAYVVAHVSQLEAERQLEAAQENEQGLQEAVTKVAALVKSLRGKSDLVSLANAERELAEAKRVHGLAAKRLAELMPKPASAPESQTGTNG